MWKICLFCSSLSHTVRHLHERWRLILFGSIAFDIEVCSFPSFHRTKETYLLPKDMIRTTGDIFYAQFVSSKWKRGLKTVNTRCVKSVTVSKGEHFWRQASLQGIKKVSRNWMKLHFLVSDDNYDDDQEALHPNSCEAFPTRKTVKAKDSSKTIKTRKSLQIIHKDNFLRQVSPPEGGRE